MAQCYEPIYLNKLDMFVPCGKCLNCISNKKREHGLRVMNEIEPMKYKHFVTLTYNDLYLPINEHNEATLQKQHIVNYIKNLDISQKRHYRAEGKEAIMKYYIGAEYAPETERPHYHMVIGSNQAITYNTKVLWQYGNAEVEDIISNKSISYTVGYTHKKNGTMKYENKEQPFHKFSKGIGRDWFEETWKKEEISVEKYYIETMQYRQGIGTYYKYLLRKKFYTYDMDELELFKNKRNWKDFQNKVIENILLQKKDETVKNNKDYYYKWKNDYEKNQFNKLEKLRFEYLTTRINEIKRTESPANVWTEICKEMKNFKQIRDIKQAKRDALAKFYMRIEKRKDIA